MKAKYTVESFKNFTVEELFSYMEEKWNKEKFNDFKLSEDLSGEKIIILPGLSYAYVKVITKLPNPKKVKDKCLVILTLEPLKEKDDLSNMFSESSEIYELYNERPNMKDKKKILECEDDVVLKYASHMRILLMRLN